MANMSYCRFANTLPDLMDCNDHLWDDLSEEEERARKQLIQLCKEIAAEFLDDEDESEDLIINGYTSSCVGCS